MGFRVRGTVCVFGTRGEASKLSPYGEVEVVPLRVNAYWTWTEGERTYHSLGVPEGYAPPLFALLVLDHNLGRPEQGYVLPEVARW
jgi:hypothetical protein